MSLQKKHLFFLTPLLFILFGMTLNAQTLYWLDASFNAPVIGKSAADGSNIQTAALSASSLPEALAYSISGSKILWTELKFSGAGLSGTNSNLASPAQIVSGTSAVRGIAVDAGNNWIYFATSNLQTKPEIDRMHSNGSGKETVLELDSITGNPRALALDADSRYLYWTEFSQAKILRVNVDAIAPPQTIVSGLNGPVGLVVDHTGGKLYWTEANSNTISRSDLNGNSKNIIVSGLATPNYLTIDTIGGFIYWTEIGISRIRKATISGNSIQTLSISVTHPTGIRFVSQYEESLPVELTSFTSSTKGSAVEVQWKTATEVNNYGFEVERRAVSERHLEGDAHFTWTKIGFVEGSGTTNASQEYSYTDRSLSVGKYSYRLKQIDRDGKFHYSSEAAVEVGNVPKVFALEQNYPNPFNPSTAIGFTLEKSGLTTLKIYDAIGRETVTLVNENLEAGVYHQRTFDGAHLSSGMYVARLESGGRIQLKKMVLIK